MLRPAFGLHSPVQSLDHFGQQVDGRDGTVERRCEHRRLASGAAADVGYAGTGRQSVDEAQRAACLGVVARALPVETGEKRCDDSVVEVGNANMLTKALIDRLINKVYVFPGDRIEIEYATQDFLETKESEKEV